MSEPPQSGLCAQSVPFADWVPSVIHELRGATAGLTMAIEVAALRLAGAGRLGTWREDCRASLGRLEALLTELSALARPAAAAAHAIDLAALLRQWADAQGEAVALQIPEIPCTAVAAPALLCEALERVWQNAREARPDARLQLRLERRPRRQRPWQLHIVQPGGQWSAEARKGAFVAFHGDKHRHLGLGLTLARAALRAMGGELSLVSCADDPADVHFIAALRAAAAS